MIRHDVENGLFYLDSEGSQTVVGLFRGRWPVLYHWGQPIATGSLERIPALPNGYSVFADTEDKSFVLQRLPLEFPCVEGGDFRSPAFLGHDVQGRACGDFVCRGWRIDEGLPERGRLPGARLKQGETGVQTLVLTLLDPLTGLVAELRYTPLDGVLLRSVLYINRGRESVSLDKALSFSADLFPDRDLEIVTLDGAWARERQMRRFPLASGRWESSSRRGVSSHQAWPGLVLAEQGSTEARGQVWGAALVWSGDWTLGVERDEDGGWRFQGGVLPETFHKTLGIEETFATPEAVLFHSAQGLSGLSALSHAFVIERLLPPAWARAERPVVANNWEATYWAFTEQKLLELADQAAACRVEVFVVDDGWFGHRDNDRSSLGDWTPHLEKLPRGLRAFGQSLKEKGLGFGLWLEPEMVSPDSDLYRAHPDWCLHQDGRQRSEGRHQLVLDLSREEVRQYLKQAITVLLNSAEIGYVKWDMNRPLSHAGVERFEWVLGLYELLGELTARFPKVLFEGCCGGGGRMDFGMLYHVPQFWTSDNTDALDRLAIQEGTSLFLPPVVMGAHVSASPNHQTGRMSSLGARTRVAFAGTFGYELDFADISREDKEIITSDIRWYQEHRRLIQQGKLRRTRTTLEDDNVIAWQLHSESGDEVLLFWYRLRAEANRRFPAYRWEGLDETAAYQVVWYQERQSASNVSGSELMHRGLIIPLGSGDADGVVVHLRRR